MASNDQAIPDLPAVARAVPLVVSRGEPEKLMRPLAAKQRALDP
jgi:hypothetical protein